MHTRSKEKVNYFASFRIQPVRQPRVYRLDFTPSFKTWWGEQYDDGKPLKFDVSQNFYLLDIATLIVVDDEPQIWGKTITNGVIDDSDKLLKEEVDIKFWIDAIEENEDFLISIKWIKRGQLDRLKYKNNDNENILKWKIGDRLRHTPMCVLYCKQNHPSRCTRCPKKPVLVDIKQTHPHKYLNQNRPEYRYEVVDKGRRKIGDGWCGEATLRVFGDNAQIEFWFIGEDDFHFMHLRRSVKCRLFKNYSTICPIPSQYRPLDCQFESIFYGKPDIFERYKHVINNSIENMMELNDEDVLMIGDFFKYLIEKNYDDISFGVGDIKTYKNVGTSAILKLNGCRVNELRFEYKIKQYLSSCGIDLFYTEKHIDFIISLDDALNKFNVNKNIKTATDGSGSEINLMSDIQIRIWRKCNIMMVKQFDYQCINGHIARFRRRNNIN